MLVRSRLLLPTLLLAAGAPAGAYNMVFTPASPSINEAAGTLAVQVALSGCTNPSNVVTWNASVEAGPSPSATPKVDFGAPSPASFAVGAGNTTRTIKVPIVNDALLEGEEFFRIVVTPGPNAELLCDEGALLPVQGQYGAVVTIIDDESQPTLSISNDRVTEGNSGTRLAVFQVKLSTASEGEVSVNYRTRDGSAHAGSDYQSAQGQLVFAPGQTTGGIDITVFGDTLVEGDETFSVDLLKPSAEATIGDGHGVGTIRDDDGAAPPPGGVRQLTAQGALERTLAPGSQTELAVRATDADGEPVALALVEWEVNGDARLVGGTASLTDPDGVATKTVVMGSTTPTAAVRAIAAGTAAVTFTLLRQASFGSLFDPTDEPGLKSVAEVLDDLCAAPGNRLAALCRYLQDLGPDDARRAITELAPSPVGAQADVAIQSARANLRAVADRQRQLHRGRRRGERAVALQLALPQPVEGGTAARPAVPGVDRGGDDSRRGGPRLDDEIDEALAGALGGDAATPQEESAAEEAGADEPRGGFFLSGRLSRGDRDATSRDPGLDYEAPGGTAGVDYRFGARTFLGLAAGYADSSADFAGDAGDLSVKGESLTSYLTYAGDRFFLDLVAGYGRDSYALHRRLSLPTGGGGTQIVTGLGEPDGDEKTAELGLGWDLAAGASTWTISGRASYVAVSIDRFVETLSAGGVELEIFDQDVDSLLAEASVEWTHAASFDWGVLQPQISAAARHEFEADAHEVRGRFVGDPAGGEFRLPTEPADETYFAAKAGLSAIFPGGWAVYANFDQEFGRDGLAVSTASAGLRFEW